MSAMSDQTYDDTLRAFDALQPGQVLAMSGDDLKPLLRRLQAERPHAFDWSVLEAGPAGSRVEIRRRVTDASGTVSEFLGDDHQRLDEILAEVTRLVGEGALPSAEQAFAVFACGLNWHIDAEETTLFPTFEQKTGMVQGPTTVMRREHVLIRRQMDEVAGGLKVGDRAATEQAIRVLTDLLADHNIKEERMLYPMADRAMQDARERDDLVNRIQAT